MSVQEAKQNAEKALKLIKNVNDELDLVEQALRQRSAVMDPVNEYLRDK